MTAPLSLFLTRFSAPQAPLPSLGVEPLPVVEPALTLTQSELDAHLEAAVQKARSEADRLHAGDLAALAGAHEVALGDALAAARAEWTEMESKRLCASIDTQLAALRDLIAERLAAVLRPLLSASACARTLEALTEAVDRLLADPSRPAIRICGPDDLLAALRESRQASGIEWVAADQAEVTITTHATRIDTQLAAALADIATTES